APPRTLNQQLTLPNKLFQAMMAGVPSVVGQGTEHCRIIEREGVGRCADVDSPGSIALAIDGLLALPAAEAEALRAHCRSVALDRYTWEAARSGLVAVFREIAAEANATRTAPAVVEATGAAPHVALLLNNPFVADSRSWKLARSLTAAGAEVTIVARTGAGLPARDDVDGVRVIRIEQPRPFAWLPTPALPAAESTLAGVSDPAPSVARSVNGAVKRAAGVVVDNVGRVGQAGRYLLLARQWAGAIAREVPHADLWQAEGLVTLPVALELRRRRGGRVVYDVRDLAIASGRFAGLPAPWRRLLERRERVWARASDALLAANQPYADEIERRLGINATIVFNGPIGVEGGESASPRPGAGEASGPLRSAASVPPGVPIVLCLGNIAPGRGVEQLCLAMGEVPDAVVVFVGPGGAFRDRIVSWAAGLPGAGRIRFLPAVGPRDIPALTADADVAAIVIQPTTLNHRLTTPTRLFDAMGAGLPVVASDLPGIAAIVRDAGMGVLCDPTDPSTIATALVDLLGATPERRLSFRSAGLAAARGRYSWSHQVEAVLGVYASLGIVLADRPTAPPTRQSGPARGPRLP
ncbi:MAG: hypothetical protein QOI00_2228, partial [Chloroflexota bacterium]|nr:hypothetical protein [Chloroflexota bacterium]